MSTRTLSVEVPEELVALLGSPEAVATQAREALVLDLLRQARVTQGKAAQLLGVTRRELLRSMAQHHVPSGPESTGELHREIEAAERYLDRR